MASAIWIPQNDQVLFAEAEQEPVQSTTQTRPGTSPSGIVQSQQASSDTPGAVLMIHKHLIEISNLARKSYEQLVHHELGYEQAYISEHQKLLQNVAAYKALAIKNEMLEQENQYWKQQLQPAYDYILSRQEKVIHETQRQAQSDQTRCIELEDKSDVQMNECKRTIQAATEMLATQGQQIEELQNRVIELTGPCHIAMDCSDTFVTGKRQNPEGEEHLQGKEHTKRGRKCK